jgi:hypothetical protein
MAAQILKSVLAVQLSNGQKTARLRLGENSCRLLLEGGKEI